MKLTLSLVVIFICWVKSTAAIKCWQCAAVDGRKCPDGAKSVSSAGHDACIIWRMGNGTILLQNLVKFDEECISSKVDFWSRFIDLYYQGVGGSVSCCSTENCNHGDHSLKTDDHHKDDLLKSSPLHAAHAPSAPLPGAPLSPFYTSSSLASPDLRSPALPQTPIKASPPTKKRPPQLIQLAKVPSYYPSAYPQLTQEGFNPNRLQLTPLNDFDIIDGQQPIVPGRNGNCQQYFDRVSSGEWLPRILIPLTFDRASETKVGVFYTRFKTVGSSNDHIITRIIDKDKRNTTMYTFKLYQVGTVSLHISKLEPDNQGNLKQVEIRKESVNHAINLTDSRFDGFWITVRDDELALGTIGSPLVQPLLVWNDTLREGPREPFYFGLTTDQAAASFGVNCDVPNLHFPDTCVTDEDCSEIPNTVCRHAPVNKGLDPGTRKIAFKDWVPRDSLLKSCFCKEGHIRIPESNGCYDPIRRVVTLRDPCFADYHCNDLPNTYCAFDKDVPKYNMSCQCVRGNRPFDPEPRTGLIEGCAPLTAEDMGTILGCSTRIMVNDAKTEWVPKDTMYAMDYDSNVGGDVGVFFVKLGQPSTQNDVAIIRLVDELKSGNKMLTVKISRRDGKISISESARSTSFFFATGERDYEKATYEDGALMTRMEEEFVGYWIMYHYEPGIGGVISVGMSGVPVAQDYAIAKWTDTADNAMKSIKYMGFTSSPGAAIYYGVNCALGNPNPIKQSPFFQTPLQGQNVALLSGYGGQGYTGERLGSIVTNLNQVRPLHSIRQFQTLGVTPDPWDYDTAREGYDDDDYVTETETIIEPVLRNQYLTKLKRLLPSVWDQVTEEQLKALAGNYSLEELMKDWEGGYHTADDVKVNEDVNDGQA